MAGLANDRNTEDRVVVTRNEEGEFVQATSEGGDVTEVTFVDDCLVAVAIAKAQPPQDEGGRGFCADCSFKIWTANTRLFPPSYVYSSQL